MAKLWLRDTKRSTLYTLPSPVRETESGAESGTRSGAKNEADTRHTRVAALALGPLGERRDPSPVDLRPIEQFQSAYESHSRELRGTYTTPMYVWRPVSPSPDLMCRNKNYLCCLVPLLFSLSGSLYSF